MSNSSDTRFQQVRKEAIPRLTNEALLHRYTVLSMQLQEEFLKNHQDFEKQKILNDEYVCMRKEIMRRMEVL